MKCGQCVMLFINGVPCHELGCPNTHARYDADTQTWHKQWICRDCGYEVDIGKDCDCSAPYDVGDCQENDHG